ncbi:tetratricopeptide repeat protein [Algivirga pacifica]|uniref:Tetratricopeptide repeat-containing protein n=1 Tax=Algivirga pacifica TaxID=1162670 RepID=A0ABP9DJ33_9BACT
MMRNFFYWTGWKSVDKVLLGIGGAGVLLALSFFLYSFWNTESTTIPLLEQSDLKALPTVLFEVDYLLSSFKSIGNVYTLNSQYDTTLLDLTSTYYPYYGLFLLLGVSMVLTALSHMRGIWFYIGLGVVFFLFASLRLEVHQVFTDIHTKLPLVMVLLITLGLTASYRFVFPVPSLWRFLSFIVAISAFVYWLLDHSVLVNPLVTLLSEGVAVPVVLTAFFVLFSAQIIPVGILYLVAGDTVLEGGRQTIKHLYGFMGIYLLNLVYGFLHHYYQVDLGIMYLSPFVLFIISTGLGFWLIRQQYVMYQKAIGEERVILWLYTGMGIIASGSMAFALIMFNQPLIIAYEGVMSIIYLGMGAAFLVYLVTVFYKELSSNIPVFQFLYKGSTDENWIGWGLGVFLVFIFSIMTGFPNYKQTLSAYYIAQADASYLNNDQTLAEQLYGIAEVYRPSARIDYSRAFLASGPNKANERVLFLKESMERENLPQGYIGLANYYQQQERGLDAIMVLEKGLERHPDNALLYNNLGMTYQNMGQRDSAFLYLEKGKEIGSPLATQNYMALIAEKPSGEEVQLKKGGAVAEIANNLSYLTRAGVKSTDSFKKEVLKDSILSTDNLCYTYNYLLNQEAAVDTTLLTQVEALEPYNFNYQSFLRFARGVVHLKKGEVATAVTLWEEVFEKNVSHRGYYAYQLGLLMLQHGNVYKASSFFEISFLAGNRNAVLPLALSKVALREYSSAKIWLNNVETLYPAYTEEVQGWLQVMESDPTQIEGYMSSDVEDPLKYKFAYWNMKQLTLQQFQSLCESITDSSIQNELQEEWVLKALKEEDYIKAAQVLEQFNTLRTTPEGKLLKWRVQAHQELQEDMLSALEALELPYHQQGWKQYFLARYFETRNQELSEEYYQEALKGIPYEVDPVIGYLAFCEKNKPYDVAYEVIYSALQRMPASYKVNKTYIQFCLRNGLETFADQTLSDSFEYLDTEEQYKLQEVYTKEVNKLQEQMSF